MAGKPIDKIGLRFGKLVVLEDTGRRTKSSQNVFWLCQCDCGNLTEVPSGSLSSGNSKSCGCANKRNFQHGYSRRKNKNPTYTTWYGMKSRCSNPNDHSYKYYGGRGIAVCERWMNFENFLIDMGERPQGMTLDRNDNEGNYIQSNCKWSTPKEQANNRRQ